MITGSISGSASSSKRPLQDDASPAAAHSPSAPTDTATASLSHAAEGSASNPGNPNNPVNQQTTRERNIRRRIEEASQPGTAPDDRAAIHALQSDDDFLPSLEALMAADVQRVSLKPQYQRLPEPVGAPQHAVGLLPASDLPLASSGNQDASRAMSHPDDLLIDELTGLPLRLSEEEIDAVLWLQNLVAGDEELAPLPVHVMQPLPAQGAAPNLPGAAPQDPQGTGPRG